MASLMRILATIVTGLCLAVVACGSGDPAGPSTPTGTGGPQVNTVVPQSQQQAQDTVLGYLRRTLEELPRGTVLDATRYGTPGVTGYCDDNDSTPTAPRNFSTIGDLRLPPETDLTEAVGRVGDIWRSWGWRVLERDGFRKPNQFAYGPDGYRLQIITAGRDGYPPTVSATSPCFPGSIARDDIGFPVEIAAGQ